MTDHIEEKLKEEITAETPDILESLLQECGFSENGSAEGRTEEDAGVRKEASGQEESKVVPFRPAGRGRVFRILAGTAAAAFLVAVGFLLYQSGLKHGAEQEQIRYAAEKTAQENAQKAAQIEQAAAEKEKLPTAVVSLDVNPSVEMTIDAAGRVLTWTAINADAEKILKGLDLAGADIKVAAYAIVGAMLTNGYLNEEVNSVLVSVVSADKEKGLELERSLSESLNTYLEESAISAAVFGQYAGDDEDVKQFAAGHHLSYGKAWLIRTLLTENPRLTEESLLKLSTQELLLLWERQPEEQTEGNKTVYGSVNMGRYVSPEEALQAALEFAGLTEADVTDPSLEISCEDGVIIYEVEFRYGGREYEIDINAVNKEVVETEFEPVRPAELPDEQSEKIPETEDDDFEYDDADDLDDDDIGDYDDDTGEASEDDRYDDENDFYETDDDDADDYDDTGDADEEEDDDGEDND